MGNSIKILCRSNITAGETLKGTIEIKSGNPKDITCVYIEFAGGESTYFEEPEDKADGTVNHISYSTAEEKINYKIILLPNDKAEEHWKNQYGDLHYFDFEFGIPEDIIETIVVSNSSVRYVLQATAERRGEFTSNLKNVKDITISKKYPLVPKVGPKVDISFPYNNFFDNDINGTVSFSTDTFRRGEKYLVEIEIHNVSEKSVKGVNIKFRWCNNIYDHKGHEKFSSTWNTFVVKHGTSRDGNGNNVPLKLNINSDSYRIDNIAPGENGKWLIEFVIPKTAPPSYKSKKFSVEYRIEVETNMCGILNGSQDEKYYKITVE